MENFIFCATKVNKSKAMKELEKKMLIYRVIQINFWKLVINATK